MMGQHLLLVLRPKVPYIAPAQAPERSRETWIKCPEKARSRSGQALVASWSCTDARPGRVSKEQQDLRRSNRSEKHQNFSEGVPARQVRGKCRITSRQFTSFSCTEDLHPERFFPVKIRSESERGGDLTLDTTQILVRRLNADGGTWGDPKRLHPNDGDDCEARDTRGRRYPPQRFEVTRPRMLEGFWKGITAGSNVPPGPAQEAARALWDGIEGKRPPKPEDVILAINAIRTPWFIQTPIVEALRRHYGQNARQVGFLEIWVVGPNETLTERLDIDSTA